MAFRGPSRANDSDAGGAFCGDLPPLHLLLELRQQLCAMGSSAPLLASPTSLFSSELTQILSGLRTELEGV
jgi:hypothetical protein